MSKGYITVVQNNDKVDYLRLAYSLALSIKKTQSKVAKLSILTDCDDIPAKYKTAFDQIIYIEKDRAKEEEWKLNNIVDLYEVSPYDETVMLDSDMIFLSDVSHWWEKLCERDLWFTTHVRNCKGQLVTKNNPYRKEFVANQLPNVYNAFFYFKKSTNAELLFNQMKLIEEDWEAYRDRFLKAMKPKVFSTDVAFALSLRLLGLTDHATMEELDIPTFVHMKSLCQDLPVNRFGHDENWRRYFDVSFFNDDGILGVKVGAIRQHGIFHYHLKDFLVDGMLEILER